MYTKCLIDDIAIEYVKNNINFKDMLNNEYIVEWMKEKNIKMYLIESENKDEIISFALFKMLKKDPLKVHTRPSYLNYIYTFPKYRQQKYATNLLIELKQIEEITVFSTDDIVTNLLIKAGFNFASKDTLYNQFHIYRYP